MVQYLHKTKVDLHGRPLYRRLGRDMLIYLDRVIEAAMPLRIVAARNKKTTSLYIWGSYLGISVDKSCRTDRRSLAVAILKRLEAAIERGES